MLSMTVRSFQKDSAKPIAFLPVYFGYERVIEASTYRAELSGKDKKSESMFDVFKIFSSFKHAFGQVRVNFGEAVILADFLDENLGGWQDPASVSSKDFINCCKTLATTLATNINTATAISPTNLVALSLLSTTRQSIEERRLIDQIDLLKNVATGCGSKGFSITSLDAHEILEEAIAITGLTRTIHKFGTIIAASPQQSVTLTYNSNNVLHLFVLPSVVCRFIRVNEAATRQALENFCEVLFPFLKAELYLPIMADDLSNEVSKVVTCLADLGILRKVGDTLEAPSPESREYNQLHDLSRMSDPTLERFYIVIALLLNDPEPSSRMLESAAAGIAEQLSVLYGINSPDFFERSLFATFLATLKQEGIINASDGRRAGLNSLEANTALTIDPDVRYNILQAVTNAPISDV
jgi:glycerol-3-phosphate O-acyltransferase